MKNFTIAIGVLLTLFILSTIFTVDETEQVVILQFGKPVKTIQNPGLNFKLPAPIQVANSFENRLNSSPNPVIFLWKSMNSSSNP